MTKVIFTKHALQRINQRRLSESDVISTLRKPDYTKPSEDQPDALISVRTLKQREIHVVSKYLADQKKTLVISNWVRGEEDPVPLYLIIITAPFNFLYWLGKKLFKKLTSLR